MKKIGFIVDMNTVKTADDLREWAQFATDHGIDGLELQYDYNDSPVFDAQLILEAMKGLAVEICACALWRADTLAQGKEGEKVARVMDELLNMAHDVHCKMVFFNAGDMHGTLPETESLFKETYLRYDRRAKELGVTISCYIGHGGSFITRRNILSRVLEDLPEFNIKLDPVGIMRNLKDDPYEIVKLYADRCVHFHVKDILRYGTDGFEIEPPVGLGQLEWNKMMALLYHHHYHGYIVIEPHGEWYKNPEDRKTHILLSKKHIEQFMLR